MSACPSPARLQDFLDERLSAAEAAALEPHLSSCSLCQQQLERLTSNANRPQWREQSDARTAQELPAEFLHNLEDEVMRAFSAPSSSLDRAREEGTLVFNARGSGAGAIAGPIVPGYEILKEVGRGGMGVVYLARQIGLNRLVAIKMILSGGHAGSRELARFRAEAEVVATLEHPHIVQIHAIGDANGLPFLCLEYLPGGNLARRLAGQPQPALAAAETIAILARTVAYAHEHGIIHRDLKPANILLTADGTPKVSDFGLAKRLQENASASGSSGIVGTPSYMAPEQALGAHTTHGPAVDVYALGAILYEMLTGVPPFRGDSPLETLVQVSHVEPLPPSRLRPQLPRDLETICLKCLEKEAGKRYGSARDLADDLRRYCAGEPIVARPVSPLARGIKWARRRPAVASLLAAVVVITVVSLGLLTWLWDEAARNADAERRSRIEVEHLSAGVWLDRGASLCEKGDVAEGLLAYARALELADHAHDADFDRVARANLAAWPARLVRQRAYFSHNSWAYAIAYSPDAKTIFTGGDDQFVKIWDAATGQECMELLKHDYPVFRIAVSPDGRRLLVGCASLTTDAGEARIWDLGARTFRRLPHPTKVIAAVFDEEGKRALTACSRFAQLWDVETGQPIGGPLAHGEYDVTAAQFSRDGRTVVTGGSDHAVRRWDASTGQMRGPPLTHEGKGTIKVVACQPGDGGALLTADDEGVVRLWHLDTGRPLGAALRQRGPVWVATFSDDGQVFAVGCDLVGAEPAKGARLAVGGEVTLWQVKDGQKLFALPHPAELRALAFSPDGQWLLTGARDGKARLYDAGSGALIGKPLVHEGTVVNVAFSKEGPPTALTASAGGDGYAAARLWELPPTRIEGRALRLEQAIMSLRFVPGNGHLLLAGERDPAVLRADLETGQVTPTPFAHKDLPDDGVDFLRLSPDGLLLLSGSKRGEVRLWNVANGTLRYTCRHPKLVNSAAFTPSGDAFWTAARDGQIRHWKTATGELILPTVSHTGRLIALHAPDAESIVWLSTDDQEAQMWKWNASEGAQIVWRQPGRVEQAVFRTDGAQVLAAGWNEAAHLRDAHTGTQLGPALNHGDFRIRALAFSPDGLTLLTGGRDKMARLWDAATGKPLGPPRPHRNLVFAAVFSPDGRRIATGGDVNVAHVWALVAPISGSADSVHIQIESLTGLELDARGAAHELDAAALHQRRDRAGIAR